MKKQLLFLAVILLPMLSYAQKGCKYERFKDPETGEFIQMITAPTKLGKFIIGKKGDELVAFYSRKDIFASVAATDNTIMLRTENVLLLFDDNSQVTIPANGAGPVLNSVKLKPQFETVNFGILIDEATLDLITEKKLKGFQVYGEKESETGDMLNDKQKEKFVQAVNCFR